MKCKLCGSDERLIDEDGVCADWFNCQRQQIADLKAEVERLAAEKLNHRNAGEDR